MQPGSVLLMPRGTWHYTEAKQDSMAMSIILSLATQIEFSLSVLKSTLLQSSEWRSPVYG
jgi:ribosomal protein L16 Arg81 hydroxylase